jgi:hypothetical protein
MLVPDEEVLPENRFVRFVTKDGATITGRLLNQGRHQRAVDQSKEELKTYIRATLREYTIVDKGLMPPSQGKLTEQQVADIVSYLSSLKGTDALSISSLRPWASRSDTVRRRDIYGRADRSSSHHERRSS